MFPWLPHVLSSTCGDVACYVSGTWGKCPGELAWLLPGVSFVSTGTQSPGWDYNVEAQSLLVRTSCLPGRTRDGQVSTEGSYWYGGQELLRGQLKSFLG